MIAGLRLNKMSLTIVSEPEQGTTRMPVISLNYLICLTRSRILLTLFPAVVPLSKTTIVYHFSSGSDTLKSMVSVLGLRLKDFHVLKLSKLRLQVPSTLLFTKLTWVTVTELWNAQTLWSLKSFVKCDSIESSPFLHLVNCRDVISNELHRPSGR